MNPLYRNDKPGELPPSWYAATAKIPPMRPSLDRDRTVDVVILGGGFCGLWAAKSLAEAGMKPLVLEAHRVGFGASGRNGGQVGTGYRRSIEWLEKHIGIGEARALWNIAEAGKKQLIDFCTTQAPEARYTPGVAHGAWTEKEVRLDAEDARHLRRNYDYRQIEALDGAAFRDIVKSERYKGGTLDMGAGHVHPLRYALALAKAAEAAGAEIFELSEVTRIRPGRQLVFETPKGNVQAKFGILAGNGYLSPVHRKVAARVMPINSFIAATEPLGDRAAEVLSRDIAVADDRFVVNYFRLSEDKRLLFGGRENYSLGFPKDMVTRLRERMEDLFPQIAGVEIEQVWGGTLGITTTRMPYVAKLAPNLMTAGGFSGHGVALSGISGRVMAEAVLGQAGNFDVMSKLPVTAFPGGAALRAPLLTLAMTWYSLRDRLGI